MPDVRKRKALVSASKIERPIEILIRDYLLIIPLIESRQRSFRLIPNFGSSKLCDDKKRDKDGGKCSVTNLIKFVELSRIQKTQLTI